MPKKAIQDCTHGCTCYCHRGLANTKHVRGKVCCEKCDTCGQNIRLNAVEEHKKLCHGNKKK